MAEVHIQRQRSYGMPVGYTEPFSPGGAQAAGAYKGRGYFPWWACLDLGPTSDGAADAVLSLQCAPMGVPSSRWGQLHTPRATKGTPAAWPRPPPQCREAALGPLKGRMAMAQGPPPAR